MKNMIIPAAFCLLCIITNPSNAQHNDKINASFAKKHSILAAFGAGQFVANMIPYQDFYLFSIKGDEENILTIGFLGMVFINS